MFAIECHSQMELLTLEYKVQEWNEPTNKHGPKIIGEYREVSLIYNSFMKKSDYSALHSQNKSFYAMYTGILMELYKINSLLMKICLSAQKLGDWYVWINKFSLYI